MSMLRSIGKHLRKVVQRADDRILIPAGVILMFALWNTVEIATRTWLMPIAVRAFRDGPTTFRSPDLTGGTVEDVTVEAVMVDDGRLDFRIGDVTFDWSTVLVNVTAFVVVLALVYITAARLLVASVDTSGMRECPECASFVVRDASRCCFCRAQIGEPGGAI